jgi:hypothetical protein
VLRAVNREVCPQLVVDVVAKAGTDHQRTCVVTVQIDDINDAPAFASSAFSRSIAENAPGKALVGTPVAANDEDPGQEHTYTIISGNDDGMFTISPCSGQISVAEAASGLLNFETAGAGSSSRCQGAASYTLQVRVEDDHPVNPLADTTTVTINVHDVAEPPFFEAPGLAATYSISEHAAPGDSVGVVQATDCDAGSTLTYSIASDDANKWSIDTATGTVTLKAGQALNCE